MNWTIIIASTQAFLLGLSAVGAWKTVKMASIELIRSQGQAAVAQMSQRN